MSKHIWANRSKLFISKSLPGNLLAAAAIGLAAFASAAENPGDQVIVVYNTQVPESKEVAEHYAKARKVPASQVFGFSLTTENDISRNEYRDKLEKPLAKKIADLKLWRIRSEIIRGNSNEASRVIWKPSESKINYAVLCYGVPFRIKPEEGLKEKHTLSVQAELRRNEAAVDSELSLLPVLESRIGLTGPLPNPLYGATNEARFAATNGLLMVTRLDGPTAEIAKGLVDKALQAEANGLWGRAYIDIRNISDSNYAVGDAWMRGAAEICRHTGFETIVESNSWAFPATFPMSQIAFYAGWYNNDVSGPFTRENVEFMPGAFAYHLHSYSAANIRSTTRHWVGPLLAKGATVSMGSVTEPYLGGTPDIAVFAGRFLFHGFNFAQSAYASQTMLSWMTTVVGDPLYRPMAHPPQKLHEELAASKSKWLEWSFLRLVNLNLARNQPLPQMMYFLEQVPLTKESPVLTEKLADMYSVGGKPSSAAEMWDRALKLNPSPEQRLRIRLALADKLTELERFQDAVDALSPIREENRDYPGMIDVYRKLAQLANRLGKKEAAASYEQLVKDLTPAAK
ncbi:MAG TPA: TIGR03790 family protein [Verrucomicrobiae bacterium]|nr:TIGR03790 family protein [Verrucomicrobiae bacterium]